MAKILFVVTGARHWTLADGSQHPTGFWAEEFVAPYEAFTQAGHEVVVATPGGVVPVVDEGSLSPDMNGGQENADAIADKVRSNPALQQVVPLDSVSLDDYIAVFYPGGHGPMEDLAVDATSGALLNDIIDSGKPLGVVCHAPAALLAATRTDGSATFAGYQVTGFSNAEEAQAGLADKAKWLLQDRLVELGVDYQEGEPWEPKVVVDRTLFTGQNPASSAPLAEKILSALA
ncbi:type 1 glutamine amidotransferase domain-containing protein [Williamsia soli]|uniref:type 1 glutamine amidotransferase domain-containing protein n=1 Tax=Williamsia soli TaxID=364929 RepID=UPI001A9FE4F2|nr:type 1 glutamine amidotransferase domain-containing protein [Williamsia soli]